MAELSTAASQMAYLGGTERINGTLTTKLVVVNKNDVAGAWAGAVLARENAAPLLMVDGGKLSKDAKTEIPTLKQHLKLSKAALAAVGGNG